MVSRVGIGSTSSFNRPSWWSTNQPNASCEKSKHCWRQPLSRIIRNTQVLRKRNERCCWPTCCIVLKSSNLRRDWWKIVRCWRRFRGAGSARCEEGGSFFFSCSCSVSYQPEEQEQRALTHWDAEEMTVNLFYIGNRF